MLSRSERCGKDSPINDVGDCDPGETLAELNAQSGPAPLVVFSGYRPRGIALFMTGRNNGRSHRV